MMLPTKHRIAINSTMQCTLYVYVSATDVQLDNRLWILLFYYENYGHINSNIQTNHAQCTS